MDKIKTRLHNALTLRDMTPAELARACGLNKSTVSRYLSGKVEPKQSAVYAMAKALNVSPAWLFGESVPMTSNVSPTFTASYDELTLLIEKLTPQDRETLKAIVETLVKKSEELKKAEEVKDNADTDI